MNPKRSADKLLKDAGFVDIERPNGTLVGAGKFGEGHYPSPKLGDDEYYRLASGWLHRAPFANEREREAWRLHSEGVPYSEIAIELGWRATNKRGVLLILEPIRQAMFAALRSTRKAGRKADPDSRGRDSLGIQYRVNSREADALHMLAMGAGLPLNETARRAFMLVSRLVLEERLDVKALNHASLGKIDAVKK